MSEQKKFYNYKNYTQHDDVKKEEQVAKDEVVKEEVKEEVYKPVKKPDPKPVAKEWQNGEILSDGAFMYSAPDDKSLSIKFIPLKSKIAIKDVSVPGWYNVYYNGEIGFIKSNFVSR